MLRAVFVESYPHVMAGQQKTMLSLLETAKRYDIQPVVIVPAGGCFATRVAEMGYDLSVAQYPTFLGRYGGAIYRDSLLSRLKAAPHFFAYLKKLRRLLKELRCEAVFCNDLRGLLTVGAAARSLRIPTVIWDKLDKPHGMLDWFQLPLASVNPIISWPVAEKYPRWQRMLFAKRIVRVPNGVDFARFQNAPQIRNELGFASNEVVFGIVGTVTPRKGHDLLIPAFLRARRRYPAIRLVVVGSWSDSDDDKSFYDRLKEMDDQGAVEFLGMRQDIPAIMNTIDVLVLPSRHEGLGQVSLEAMAAAKPVIGTRVGGIQETIIDGVTGRLVDSEDVGGLQVAIEQLAAEGNLRRQMGIAGRERVQAEYVREEKMAEVCQMLLNVARVD